MNGNWGESECMWCASCTKEGKQLNIGGLEIQSGFWLCSDALLPNGYIPSRMKILLLGIELPYKIEAILPFQ